MKLCIDNVATGGSFPARTEDFESEEAFQIWKRQESSELQELLIKMIERNPLLVKSTRSEFPSAEKEVNGGGSSRNSVGPDITGSRATLEDDSQQFYFVPPDPKYYYRRLIEIALECDIDSMKDLPPDEDVALSILSSQNEELLLECSKRWRIMPTFKVTSFLSNIVTYHTYQAVPIACVGEALENLEMVANEWEYWRWPMADVSQISSRYPILTLFIAN